MLKKLLYLLIIIGGIGAIVNIYTGTLGVFSCNGKSRVIASADTFLDTLFEGKKIGYGYDITADTETRTFISVDLSGTYYMDSGLYGVPRAKYQTFHKMGLKTKDWKRTTHADIGVYLTFPDVTVPNGDFSGDNVAVTAKVGSVELPAHSTMEWKVTIKMDKPVEIYVFDSWQELMTDFGNNGKNIMLTLVSNGAAIPLYKKSDAKDNIFSFENFKIEAKEVGADIDDPNSPNYNPGGGAAGSHNHPTASCGEMAMSVFWVVIGCLGTILVVKILFIIFDKKKGA